jgi:hypothetical protein
MMWYNHCSPQTLAYYPESHTLLLKRGRIMQTNVILLKVTDVINKYKCALSHSFISEKSPVI